MITHRTSSNIFLKTYLGCWCKSVANVRVFTFF